MSDLARIQWQRLNSANSPITRQQEVLDAGMDLLDRAIDHLVSHMTEDPDAADGKACALLVRCWSDLSLEWR